MMIAAEGKEVGEGRLAGCTSSLVGGATSTVGSVTPPPTTALPEAAGTATGCTRLCKTAAVRSLLRDLPACAAFLGCRDLVMLLGHSRPAPLSMSWMGRMAAVLEHLYMPRPRVGGLK